MEGVSFDGLMVLSSIQMMGTAPWAPGSRFPASVALGNYRSIFGAATAGKRVSRTGRMGPDRRAGRWRGAGEALWLEGKGLMRMSCRRAPAPRVPVA